MEHTLATKGENEAQVKLEISLYVSYQTALQPESLLRISSFTNFLQAFHDSY